MKSILAFLFGLTMIPTAFATEDLKEQLEHEKAKTHQMQQEQSIKNDIAAEQQTQQKIASGQTVEQDHSNDPNKSKFVQNRDKVEREANRVVNQVKGLF